MIETITMDSTRTLDRPFKTPMMIEAYEWASGVVSSGHTGGVMYAPTRTGKTTTIQLSVEALKSFRGPRGIVESATIGLVAYDRMVTSEGGFWDWLLQELGHAQAGRKMRVIEKRNCVCDFVKGLARGCPSCRVIIFVDEAQFLQVYELGWFADLFNNLHKDGFKMVLFLVGSYLLGKWQIELQGQPQEHVKSRFFANEHRLRGLTTLNDYKLCLQHFDKAKVTKDSVETYTQAYLPEWFERGGRLEQRADMFRAAFADVAAQKRNRTVDVPMMYFKHLVKRVLEYDEHDIDFEAVKQRVISTGFDQFLDGLNLDGKNKA